MKQPTRPVPVGGARTTVGRMRPSGLVVLALGVVLVSGCAPSAQPSVPQVTVSGEPDTQRSLAPDEVLPARKAAGIADCPTSDPKATQREGGLPAVALDCMGGDTTVNLAGLPTGKPRVINVWAQWCYPCNAEAPFLAQASKELEGKVDFLGIDYDDPFPGKALDFAERHQTLYPQLVDPKKATRVPLKVSVVPQTFFVDAQGKVVHRELTPFESVEDLRAAVDKHLGVKA